MCSGMPGYPIFDRETRSPEPEPEPCLLRGSERFCLAYPEFSLPEWHIKATDTTGALISDLTAAVEAVKEQKGAEK